MKSWAYEEDKISKDFHIFQMIISHVWVNFLNKDQSHSAFYGNKYAGTNFDKLSKKNLSCGRPRIITA